MTTIKTAILIIALTSLSPLEAGIYKCIIDDKPMFSQLPCAADAEVITVTPPQKSTTAPYQGSARQKMQLRFEAHDLRTTTKRNAAETKKLDRKITQYKRKMNTKLNALKRKKGRANNNLAGAQWESSISEEMTAVTNKYNQLISNAREDKRQLEQK
jgi:predicted RNase H-like nuclease (RuvC/YqgF family)